MLADKEVHKIDRINRCPRDVGHLLRVGEIDWAFFRRVPGNHVRIRFAVRDSHHREQTSVAAAEKSLNQSIVAQLNLEIHRISAKEALTGYRAGVARYALPAKYDAGGVGLDHIDIGVSTLSGFQIEVVPKAGNHLEVC